MKRTFALLVATLCYFCTYSQEAESVDNTPNFTIIPRVDVNPYIPVGIGHKDNAGIDFGNTSLYSIFEGNIGRHFSYSMCNHWLSTDPKPLYQNTFRSDDVNWVDWLTFSYSAGDFTFTLGKDVLAIGGYEIDALDVDSHINLSSTIWNNLAIYQWGAKAEYTTPSENSNFALQFATSPFAERPFAGKLFTYSLYWTGEYGPFSPIWSASFMEYERGRFISIISLGNRFDIGDFAIEVDYMNRANSAKRFFNQEMTLLGRLSYSMNDKAEFFIKGGYEYRHGDEDLFGYGDEWEFDGSMVPTGILARKDYVFYGAGVHYYPLRDSQDLRLHAVVAANNYSKRVSVTLGATYYFDLTGAIRARRNR